MEQYYKTDVNKTERGYLSLDILFSEEVNRAIINESVNHRRIFSCQYKDRNYPVLYPPFFISRTISVHPNVTIVR